MNGFVTKGEVAFGSLLYFKNRELDPERQDAFEGIRAHTPENGLRITMVATGEERVLNASYQSSINDTEVFAFCSSTELSPEQMNRLGAVGCVEIHDPSKFISKIRAAVAIRSKIKNKRIFTGEVQYYTMEEPVLGNWIDEKVAFSKRDKFIQQSEHRIVFSTNPAFGVGVDNTQHKIVFGNTETPATITTPKPFVFRLGNLSSICKIHLK